MFNLQEYKINRRNFLYAVSSLVFINTPLRSSRAIGFVEPRYADTQADTPDNIIRIGSIIHLENGLRNSGYLDVRGWVRDNPVISQFQDQRIRQFVSTHQNKRRSIGSGSWLVLSAEDKPVGAPLVVGDKIHLLNMNPGAGYLDTFEWIWRLEPFKEYPLEYGNGVFATSTPKRDGGPTGTWTIRSATNKQQGDALVENDTIYLENGFPINVENQRRFGFLTTYNGTLVTEHPMFKGYEGQRRFVFTTTDETEQHGSRQWTVTLSHILDNLYDVQNLDGHEHTSWHERELFKIGDSSDQSITALNCTSGNQGKTLSGTVIYRDTSSMEVDFKATLQRQNIYDIDFSGDSTLDNTSANTSANTPANTSVQSQWLLGARKHQHITAMTVQSDDDGRTLHGTITYAGEGPIHIKAVREFKTISDVEELLSALVNPEWVQGRIERMESKIVEIDEVLSGAFQEISGISIDDVLQYTYPPVVDGGSNGNGYATLENTQIGYADLQQLWDKAKSAEPQDSFVALDPDFQIEQQLSLHILSFLLNSFSRYTLHKLMRQSLEMHRKKQGGSVVPLHLFRQCFEHIETDQEIIRQATRQRRWNLGLEGNYLSASEVELLILDKLAIRAVAPFEHLLLDSRDVEDNLNLVIITYLSKRTHIHIMPYTKQFMLIGVSADRVPPAASIFEGKGFLGENFHTFELMAIPHEVGHHIYQYGKLTDGTTFPEISEKFEDSPYYRWCEELFADVYGCIVAGPFAAISMEALLMSIDRDRVWKDDEDHPTPVLRVFIFAEILRRLQKIRPNRYAFPKVTKKLDSDWSQILALWGYDPVDQRNRDDRPVRVYMYDRTALHLEQIVNVERVIEEIRPMIDEFAKHLLDEARIDATEIPWTRQDEDTIWWYNVEMARLINLDFASDEVQRQVVINPQVDSQQVDVRQLEGLTPDEQLEKYLEVWDDHGPHGPGNVLNAEHALLN
ncbi:MAG: hypothetical protein AAF639_08105 [Chloroflexota bacterium]